MLICEVLRYKILTMSQPSEANTSQSERFRYFLFTSEGNPITRGTEISRYLTFEKFVWLLEKSALYHARLDTLGDPFEGAVTTPYADKRNSGELIGYMPAPQYEGINNIRLM